MPLQNRVAPTGQILAEPERGLLTGNRGVLHRADGTVGIARWRTRAGICCRRADWQRFVACWAAGHDLSAPPATAQIDRALHDQRVDPRTRRHRRHLWPAADRPDGAMIEGLDGRPSWSSVTAHGPGRSPARA